jgi:hypothetical protein
MTTLRDQIQNGVQAALKGAVEDVAGRVFVELDRKYDSSDCPCLNIHLGPCKGTYVAGENAGPGERLLQLQYSLEISVVDNETVSEFRSRTKAISSEVRAAMARFQETMPELAVTDCWFLVETPVNWDSIEGRAGRFVVDFMLFFTASESDQDTALS